MGNSKLSLLIFLGFAAAVAVVILISQTQFSTNRKLKSITTFEDCRSAGYPVSQGAYPECALPNGITFTQTTSAVECGPKGECPENTVCKNHQCVSQ